MRGADSEQRSAWAGQALVGAAVFALTDALHESGHLVATLLPGQGVVTSISSVGVSTSTSSAVVASAGPLLNLLLGFGGLLIAHRMSRPSGQLAAWLFGTVNLFNCVAYLLYSAALGSGDWATVFASFAPALVWRPAAGLAGALLYAGVVALALGRLRRLIGRARIGPSAAHDFCLTAYWAGGLLLTVAATLNPISPWLILTSGMATGFGAMAGLIVVAKAVKNVEASPSPRAEPVRFGMPWLLAGAVVSLAFVLILGPGIALA